MADTPTLKKDLRDKGWQIGHAQEPQSIQHEGQAIRLRAGNYVAFKRDGTTLVEQAAESPEALEAQLEAYENAVGNRKTAAENAAEHFSEEQAMQSAIGTMSQAISSGARQAGEVRLTLPQEPEEAPVDARIEIHPPVQVVSLEDGETVAEGTVQEVSQQAGRKAKGVARKSAKAREDEQ